MDHPEDVVTSKIIRAAIEVHKAFGPGLLESGYEACLYRELELAGICFQRQLAIPVSFKGIILPCAYRVDLLVEDLVIVELKSISDIEPIHHAQLLTYLRLLDRKVGLLINFNVVRLTDGLKRYVNKL